MKRIPLAIAATIAVTAGLLAAAPAHADGWEGRGYGGGGRGHEWREHEWREHEWREHRGWGRPYYAPPPVAYAPSYYPPPVVYAPPPVYSAPFISFGFGIR